MRGSAWQAILAGALAAIAGGWAGAWASARMEWQRWRRDLLMKRIDDMQAYFGEACEALHDQHRMLGQKAGEVCGRREPVPSERVPEADRRWGRVLARGGVSAPAEVQNALFAFDVERARAVETINARDTGKLAPALAELDGVYEGAMIAMQAVQHQMNDELALFLLP